MDSDGQGEVWFGSMKLKGGWPAGFYWQPQYAPDDDYHYHKIANTLIFTSDGHEEFVLIRDFESHDLGIHLNGDVNKDRVLRDFAWVYDIDSPIALDLNGDGLATTSLDTSTSYFDYGADGFAELTGWLNNQDGFLVLDRNGNGIIDNGLELFGSQTLLSNGAYAANGYEALAELDENSDGFIDAQDSIYTSLGVWQDQNGDGKSEADELLNLPLAHVQSVGIGYTDSDLNDQGNTIKQIGTFTKTDGTPGQTGDIWFQTNDVYSIATNLLSETPEIASLPNVSGYRNVYDLQCLGIRRGNCKH